MESIIYNMPNQNIIISNKIEHEVIYREKITMVQIQTKILKYKMESKSQTITPKKIMSYIKQNKK